MTALRSEPAFLGTGWARPVCLEGGRAAMVSGETDIEQAIRIILLTNHGERLMRPDFGAGLRDFLFEPASTATLEAIRARVTSALIDFEPRIEVESVTATTEPGAPSTVLIGLRYRVRASNTHHNLVYPFYLEEGPTR